MNPPERPAGDRPHRRFNPLTGEWLLVSPHRTSRPWHGHREAGAGDPKPAYDPKCYLCPGNKRAGGAVNPAYAETFVFTNDYAAVLPDGDGVSEDGGGLIRREPVRGTCRVICFSPRHDLTLAEMDPREIRRVIDLWAEQAAELGAEHAWVQVFENKGPIMGCSNPHPHGQVWATDTVPHLPALEDARQLEHRRGRGSLLLLDYLREELQRGERIVARNDFWAALVPYWAVWPFETLVVPREHRPRLEDLAPGEREGLAAVLKDLLVRYDNLFECSFPYSMGWHGAPGAGRDGSHWQLHAHFYPPLLRSAAVKKFMVGYEMLAEAQRDITAETAAARLREAPAVHYKLRAGG